VDPQPKGKTAEVNTSSMKIGLTIARRHITRSVIPTDDRLRRHQF
jgi:hypothetical protein